MLYNPPNTVNFQKPKVTPWQGVAGTVTGREYGSNPFATSVPEVPWALYPKIDLGPFLLEKRWSLVPMWTGAEIIARIGFRAPDRPVHSECLHRLHNSDNYKFSHLWKLKSLIQNASTFSVNRRFISDAMFKWIIHYLSETSFRYRMEQNKLYV